MRTVLAFSVCLISLLVADLIWLGLIANKFYLTHLGSWMRKSGHQLAPVLWTAILVYIALAVGIVTYVLPKANGDWKMALAWGAGFGLITYTIYDFTNYSILANWSLIFSIVDMMWGTILCGLAAGLTCYLMR